MTRDIKLYPDIVWLFVATNLASWYFHGTPLFSWWWMAPVFVADLILLALTGYLMREGRR